MNLNSFVKTSYFKRLRFALKNALKLRKFASQKNNTEKSRKLIFKELFLFALKYRFFFKNYFIYQLDRKDRNLGNFIPVNVFKVMRDTFNKNSSPSKEFHYNSILRDKYLFEVFMKAHNIKTVESIFKWNNSESLTEINSGITLDFDKLLDYEIDGFLKSVSGEEGHDVFHIKIADKEISLDGRNITFEKFKSQFNSPYLIQERIIQHDDISKIYDKSVNTLRIITFKKDHEIEVFDNFLRVGSNGITKDNLSQGGILIPVDSKKYCLTKNGYIRDGLDLKIVDKHPNSKIKFENYEIPYVKEALDLVKSAHKNIWFMHSIGWDIAITDEGPLILEGNDNWSLVSPQTHRKNGCLKEISKYYNLEEK